jgi:signal transduction histidine kinase
MTTPVRSFENALPTTAIAEVVSLAKRSMRLSRDAEHDLTLVLSELVQNVLDHSRSQVGGFLSARAYREVREVRLAVADFGVGIRESLAARVPSADDKEAIRLALQEEVTGRTSPRNLGLGLSHLHVIVRRTGGQMVIYSRRGFLRFEGGRDTFGLANVSYPGTIVFVRLPLREGDDHEPSVDIWG